MLYYSEVLDRLFKTEKELKENEQEYNKKLEIKKAEEAKQKAARDERKKKIEEAYQAKLKADKQLNDLLKEENDGDYRFLISLMDLF